MFCSNCGTQFEGKFCPECGTPAIGQISAVNSGLEKQEKIEAILALYDFYQKLYPSFVEYVSYEVELEQLIQQRQRAVNTDYVGQIEKKSGVLKKLGKATLAAYTLGASLAVSSAIKKSKEKEAEKTNETMKENVVATIDVNICGVRERTEMKGNEIRTIINDRSFQKARLELPEECCDYDAIVFLYNVIKQGRADTWKELINLYHDELYKSEMIENSREQLKILESGVKMQQEIIDITYGIMQEVSEINAETCKLLQGTEALVKQSLMQTFQTNELFQAMNQAMETQIKQNIKSNRNIKKIRRGIFFNSLLTFFK